jgi:hypothetical protein
MKVLLDVCTPVQVRDALPGHFVLTAARLGWAKLENGDLLRMAEEAGFDLFIICDKNMRHQQNLAARTIAILELWTNHRPTLEKDWARIRENAESMKPGEYRSLPPPMD